MEIIRVTKTDIEELTILFDGYRQFYKQESDLPASKNFLLERLERNEARIFIAREDGKALGFTLLYPSFSSVSMRRVFILNDLFVTHEARRKGVGAALLSHAVDYGREHGSLGLHLETGIENYNAQKLYEKEGWIRETEVYHYNYTL